MTESREPEVGQTSAQNAPRADHCPPWVVLVYCLVGCGLPVIAFTKATNALLGVTPSCRRSVPLLFAVPILFWIGGVLVYGAGLDGVRYAVSLLLPQPLIALALSVVASTTRWLWRRWRART